MNTAWGKQKQGFTIVELLIVVVVIAILAAITIVAYNGIQNRAKVSSLQSELTNTAKVLETKRLQDSAEQYPATLTTANIALSNATYIYESSDNSFCLTKTNGSLSYYVSNNQKNATEGNCGGDSLVSWWRFNGNANDSVGSNNGTVSNATLATGKNGQANSAYSFNGTNASINFGNSATFNQPSVTMSIWAQPVGVSTTQMLLGKEFLYKYRLNGVGISTLISANGTSWSSPQPTTAATATAGTWIHAVITFDSSTNTLKVYSNGTLLATNAFTAPITGFNSTNFYAGSTSGASEFFSGVLDDARIYNRVLSAAEIKGLFNANAQ